VTSHASAALQAGVLLMPANKFMALSPIYLFLSTHLPNEQLNTLHHKRPRDVIAMTTAQQPA